ncbi:hypothetical protein MKY80_06645 [Lysinibacillus sp. FSL R5-0849]|uniref:hypothetical protein n=1 Tax=Lysinibacillus sp. FSL R5-0849 TaxID=2921660 RepID=UPI00315A99F0
MNLMLFLPNGIKEGGKETLWLVPLNDNAEPLPFHPSILVGALVNVPVYPLIESIALPLGSSKPIKDLPYLLKLSFVLAIVLTSNIFPY